MIAKQFLEAIDIPSENPVATLEHKAETDSPVAPGPAINCLAMQVTEGGFAGTFAARRAQISFRASC